MTFWLATGIYATWFGLSEGKQNVLSVGGASMKSLPLPRLDRYGELHDYLLKYCRLRPGDVWKDPKGYHKVGCLDATNRIHIRKLMKEERAVLAVQDPPYNLVAFERAPVAEYIRWCKKWVRNTDLALCENSALYVWMGADQTAGFQPLPDFIVMMRGMPFTSRSFITMRNQRGYGTQQNWMAVRQELLYYVKGAPVFNVDAEYTDIPKILRGYYKPVDGHITENLGRGKSDHIRAGNVWVDVQQVFYRMEENVHGCYAQKPLKSCDRILRANSNPGDLIVDFFSHSGTTLLAAEMSGRRCYAADLDPLYCEISIRRIEHFRATGQRGWQHSNPFATEIATDSHLQALLGMKTESPSLWATAS